MTKCIRTQVRMTKLQLRADPDRYDPDPLESADHPTHDETRAAWVHRPAAIAGNAGRVRTADSPSSGEAAVGLCVRCAEPAGSGAAHGRRPARPTTRASSLRPNWALFCSVCCALAGSPHRHAHPCGVASQLNPIPGGGTMSVSAAAEEELRQAMLKQMNRRILEAAAREVSGVSKQGRPHHSLIPRDVSERLRAVAGRPAAKRHRQQPVAPRFVVVQPARRPKLAARLRRLLPRDQQPRLGEARHGAARPRAPRRGCRERPALAVRVLHRLTRRALRSDGRRRVRGRARAVPARAAAARRRRVGRGGVRDGRDARPGALLLSRVRRPGVRPNPDALLRHPTATGAAGATAAAAADGSLRLAPRCRRCGHARRQALACPRSV